MIQKIQLKLLEKTLEKSAYSPNHQWGKAKIVNIDTEGAVHIDVEVLRVCKICKSTRTRTFSLHDDWRGKEYWLAMEPHIEHSHKYKQSPCHKSHKRVHRVPIPQPYTCKLCGATFSYLKGAMQCEKKHKEEKQRQNQISRNINIMKDAKEEYRRNLAIYRLYKYCHISPKEIASYIEWNVSSVKKVIGEVFGILCILDKSCPFKQFFEVKVNYTKSIVKRG